MRQYTNTYRITITDEMLKKLKRLKSNYHIKPTTFIRQAIAEKLNRDMPALKTKKQTIEMPF